MDLGVVYSDLGENQKALELYNEALLLQRAIGDKSGEADMLVNLAARYEALGENQKALEFLNQALPLERAVGDKTHEATTLMDLGTVYTDLGENQKALEFLNKALLLQRAVGDKSGEADTLFGLGKLYYVLGEKQKALEFLNPALSLMRTVGDKSAEATALSGLGVVYSDLGENQKALEFHNKALLLQRAVGDKRGEANTLDNLGDAYYALGERQRALEFLNQALLLTRSVGDKSTEATTLNDIGYVHSNLGENQEALEFYKQALPLERAVGDKAGEALTLGNLMELWKGLGKPALAIFYGKQAINDYQQLRSNIQGLEKEIQRTYLHSVEKRYRQLADFLISEGRLPEAQQVLGLLKEEEYFEFVRRDSNEASSLKGKAELTPEEAALANRYNEIADRVTAIGVEYGHLRDKKTRTPEEEQRMAKLESDLTVANQVFQKFLDEIDKSFSGSAPSSEKAFQLRESQGLQNTLRELGSGAVALYTVVGEDQYRVILITPEVQKAYEYSIKGADLNRKVLAFREAIQNPHVDPRPLAQELYKILIGSDLARDLEQANAQTLMWSLDGVLRYLPVAALHDGKGYLVECYRNVVFTPASQSRLKDPVSAKWKALGLGVSKAQPGFNPLPGVPEELRGIIRDESAKPNGTSGSKTIPAAGVLAGTVMLDEAFTSNAMQTALHQHYALVHIASHFQFHPGNETDSFLLLGDGSHLTLAQIKSLPNVFSGVDLLTLSACDTAMGGAGANGKEVEGFGVLAQRQGAKAVLATLWPVADESTQLLMREFYQLHEGSPQWTKAEALQQAQLFLLHGHNKDGTVTTRRRSPETVEDSASPSALAFPPDPNVKYSHPYYWAPFILIGNWR
jgi:CHAT domain-containing protein/Tfp pilus assembly protein PilF